MTSQSNWAMGKCPYCDMPNEECECSEGLDELERQEEEDETPW